MSVLARVIAAVVLIGSVAGCGWQLRGAGQAELAERAIVLEARMGEGELSKQTRQSLRRIGAAVAADGADAPVLELIDEATRQRTIATDDDGRASAWELTYRLRFAFNPASGDAATGGSKQALIRPRTVSVSDTYEAAPRDTLAEQAQRRRLSDELREQAVRLMLSQVATALGDSS